jgi:uroporphyrinogen-III synthase
MNTELLRYLHQGHPPARSPLQDKYVVVTRASHQANEMASLLRQRGAAPILYPCIAITPVEDLSAFDAALEQARQGVYDWLIVTSFNVVTLIAERLRLFAIAPTQLRLKIAAVGPITAQAVETSLGLKAAALPDEYRAQALARAVLPQPGMRVLLPQGDLAPATLEEDLTAMGLVVDRHTIYRTTTGRGGAKLPTLLQQRKAEVPRVQAITFTSSSAVRGFAERMQQENRGMPDLTGIVIACIGPSTRQTALELGLAVTVMPNCYTLPDLIESLEEYFDAS